MFGLTKRLWILAFLSAWMFFAAASASLWAADPPKSSWTKDALRRYKLSTNPISQEVFLIRALELWMPVGAMAPDIDLPLVKAVKDKGGKEIGIVDGETVRLSSFRGKKPVLLILTATGCGDT